MICPSDGRQGLRHDRLHASWDMLQCRLTRGPPKHPLLWRHNGRDGVSNHQPHDCLLNRLFRRRSKQTSKLRVTGLCVGNSPHKRSVTRKMFPFDDVIMIIIILEIQLSNTFYVQLADFFFTMNVGAFLVNFIAAIFVKTLNYGLELLHHVYWWVSHTYILIIFRTHTC